MTNKELEKKVTDLEVLVKQVLEQKVDKPPEAPKREVKEVTIDEAINAELGGLSDPINPDYRDTVNKVLNQSFGIHLKSEGGAFRFTVLVPDKYSKLNQEQRKMLKFDARTRAIESGEGVNGVKIWCETVFNSFDNTYQSMIVSDRNL